MTREFENFDQGPDVLGELQVPDIKAEMISGMKAARALEPAVREYKRVREVLHGMAKKLDALNRTEDARNVLDEIRRLDSMVQVPWML